MSKATETVKAARNSHRLSFVVSFTALALLFAPPHVDFQSALQETYALRKLKMSDYETFLRDLSNPISLLPVRDDPWPPPDGYGGEITNFLNATLAKRGVIGEMPPDKVRKGPDSDPNWAVMPIVDYERPPTNGTIQQWSEWVQSTKPGRVLEPGWLAARFGSSRALSGRVPRVRFFSVKPNIDRDGEYLFRAYCELGETDEHSQVPSKDDDWWSEIEQEYSRELSFHVGKHPPPIMTDDRFVLEGGVGGEFREMRNSGVRSWLTRSGRWPKLTESDDLGETVLPALRVHWSTLQDKPLSDAITFMEDKQRDIQDVSLFGIPIPGQLCVVAIPMGYLVLFLHLLIHLRCLRRIQDANSIENVEDAPWMGLYHDRLAIWVTIVSITFAPLMLSAALLIRYHDRVASFAFWLSIIAVVIVAYVGAVATMTVAVVRKKLAMNG